MWRPVDRYATVHQALANLIDVVDGVGEMTEVSALVIILGIPIMGKLDLSFYVTGGGQEYQRKSPLVVLVTIDLLETQLVAIEVQRLVEIAYPDHGVQIFHVD